MIDGLRQHACVEAQRSRRSNHREPQAWNIEVELDVKDPVYSKHVLYNGTACVFLSLIMDLQSLFGLVNETESRTPSGD